MGVQQAARWPRERGGGCARRAGRLSRPVWPCHGVRPRPGTGGASPQEAVPKRARRRAGLECAGGRRRQPEAAPAAATLGEFSFSSSVSFITHAAGNPGAPGAGAPGASLARRVWTVCADLHSAAAPRLAALCAGARAWSRARPGRRFAAPPWWAANFADVRARLGFSPAPAAQHRRRGVARLPPGPPPARQRHAARAVRPRPPGRVAGRSHSSHPSSLLPPASCLLLPPPSSCLLLPPPSSLLPPPPSFSSHFKARPPIAAASAAHGGVGDRAHRFLASSHGLLSRGSIAVRARYTPDQARADTCESPSPIWSLLRCG